MSGARAASRTTSPGSISGSVTVLVSQNFTDLLTVLVFGLGPEVNRPLIGPRAWPVTSTRRVCARTVTVTIRVMTRLPSHSVNWMPR